MRANGCLGLLLAVSICWVAGCEEIEGWFGGGPQARAAEGTSAGKGAKKKSEPEPEPEPPKTDGPTLQGPMTGFYEYVDEHGVVNFVDHIDKVPPRFRKRARHPTGGAVTIVPATPVDDVIEKYKLDPKRYGKSAEIKTHGKVFLYTTSWCPHCVRARDHLRARGVEFEEKDIERSRENLEEMLQKSGGARGVPVIDVHGTVLRGFSPQAIDQALGG